MQQYDYEWLNNISKLVKRTITNRCKRLQTVRKTPQIYPQSKEKCLLNNKIFSGDLEASAFAAQAGFHNCENQKLSGTNHWAAQLHCHVFLRCKQQAGRVYLNKHSYNLVDRCSLFSRSVSSANIFYRLEHIVTVVSWFHWLFRSYNRHAAR